MSRKKSPVKKVTSKSKKKLKTTRVHIGISILALLIFGLLMYVQKDYFAPVSFGGNIEMLELPTEAVPVGAASSTSPENISTTSGSSASESNSTVHVPGNIQSEISRGDTTKNQVIFTFDGGSGIQSATAILDVLKKHEVKSTFFVTGKWMEENPDIIKSIVAEGHEVFNHTYSHPHLTRISDAAILEEFAITEKIMMSLTGKFTKPYFRPPYGDRNSHVLSVAAQAGYRSIYWTVDALDWKEGISATEVKNRIYSDVSPGAIYLMHIGDVITGEILDEVFTEIKSRGFDIVSLTRGL